MAILRFLPIVGMSETHYIWSREWKQKWVNHQFWFTLRNCSLRLTYVGMTKLVIFFATLEQL